MSSLFSQTLWELHSFVYDFKVSAKVHQDLQDDIVKELGLKTGQRLLDAGIGTGPLELALIRAEILDVQIVGVDLSEQMLNRAKVKLANKFKNLDLIRLDLNSPLPFPENYFDRIASSNTFYILQNQLDALKEFYRVLKPGGRIVITTPHEKFKGSELMKYHYNKANKLEHYLKAFLETIAALIFIIPFELLITFAEKKGEYTHLDQESLEKLFKSAGFNSHKIRLAFAEQNWLVTAVK